MDLTQMAICACICNVNIHNAWILFGNNNNDSRCHMVSTYDTCSTSDT